MNDKKYFVQDVAGGHQCESEQWSDIFIKYFRNTEIKTSGNINIHLHYKGDYM